MVASLNPSARRLTLAAIASLSVAYVRTHLQYGRGFKDINEWLTFWLLHYFALVLLFIAVFIAIERTKAWFADVDAQVGETDRDAVYVQFHLTALIASVAIWLFSHSV